MEIKYGSKYIARKSKACAPKEKFSSKRHIYIYMGTAYTVYVRCSSQRILLHLEMSSGDAFYPWCFIQKISEYYMHGALLLLTRQASHVDAAKPLLCPSCTRKWRGPESPLLQKAPNYLDSNAAIPLLLIGLASNRIFVYFQPPPPPPLQRW